VPQFVSRVYGSRLERAVTGRGARLITVAANALPGPSQASAACLAAFRLGNHPTTAEPLPDRTVAPAPSVSRCSRARRTEATRCSIPRWKSLKNQASTASMFRGQTGLL